MNQALLVRDVDDALFSETVACCFSATSEAIIDDHFHLKHTLAFCEEIVFALT